MDLPDEETRRIHGLRLRDGGRLLRVREHLEHYGDQSEERYTLVDDPAYPVFDAGSPERLALAFSPTYGSSRDRPLRGAFRVADVEPAIIEERLTRRLIDVPVAFDAVVEVDLVTAIDIRRAYTRSFDGLGPILDVLDAHAKELAAVPWPDGDWAWGKHAVIGYLVRDAFDGLSGDIVGSIVDGASRRGPTQGRRAVGIVGIPDDRRESTGEANALVVCLADIRRLPDHVLEALAELDARRTASPPAP